MKPRRRHTRVTHTTTQVIYQEAGKVIDMHHGAENERKRKKKLGKIEKGGKERRKRGDG